MDKFMSCDWGTSTFRLRLVDSVKREISAEVKSDEGISETYQQWLASGKRETERIDFYRRKLSDAIRQLPVDHLKNLPIILSGMASSSIGLEELPYQAFPFNWNVAQFPVKKINEDEKFSHPLYLVSGFKTDIDVMRGEESMLLGCDVTDDHERIFIFPGTHSKHVLVRNKSGVDMKTYMTGEIFNLLAEKSILRHAVEKGTDETAFAEGFQAGLDGNILHLAFMVRTKQILHHADPVSGYQFLSGLLIGAELGHLRGNNYPVYLVCSENISRSYIAGLKLMDADRQIFYLNDDETLIEAHCKLADYFF